MVVEYAIETKYNRYGYFNFMVRITGQDEYIIVDDYTMYFTRWGARRAAKKWIRTGSVPARQYPVKKTIYRVEVPD